MLFALLLCILSSIYVFLLFQTLVNVCRDVLELLATLFTDSATIADLNDIPMEHLDFIRFIIVTYMKTTHCDTELQRVFETKEKNKEKSRDPVRPLSADLKDKQMFLRDKLKSGLDTLSTDQLAEFSSYLDDLDSFTDDNLSRTRVLWRFVEAYCSRYLGVQVADSFLVGYCVYASFSDHCFGGRRVQVGWLSILTPLLQPCSVWLVTGSC